ACPTFQTREMRARPMSLSFWGKNVGAYGYNFGGVAQAVDQPNCLGLDWAREARVRAPHDMIALGDAAMRVSGKGNPTQREYLTVDWGQAGLIFLSYPDLPGNPESHEAIIRTRHAGRLNVSLCDGHVESANYRRLYLNSSDQARRRWNIDNEPHNE